MTAALISLLIISAQQAPAQPVSLTDVLVEAQTLYTLAVDKQPESLTAALDLARQAQRAVADDTIRKRLPAGAQPDPQDLTVLGSLRARIGILVNGTVKRRDYFIGQFQDIQKLLARERFDDARAALDNLPADAPSADPACPFADLRAELDRNVAQIRRRDSSTPASHAAGTPATYGAGTPANRKGIAAGVAFTTVFTVAALAAHSSMNGTLDRMTSLPPGSVDWWAASSDADQMRKIRNGFALAAVGTGVALTIYGAAKAARNNTAAGRSSAPPSKPRTWVGFNFDLRNPAITVVRIF